MNAECSDNEQCQNNSGNITCISYHDYSTANDRDKNSGYRSAKSLKLLTQ